VDTEVLSVRVKRALKLEAERLGLNVREAVESASPFIFILVRKILG